MDCGLLSKQRREKYKNHKAMNAQKIKEKSNVGTVMLLDM